MSGKKVLVVDDDAKTAELVKLYLSRDGYRVLTAGDGNEALRLARENHPDLIVLDLMLPGISGLEVCRILREESDVPIIMLTALTTDEDRLKGLELGADDYVTKPFSPRELAARVRAVLRRLPGERGPEKIEHGALTVDFLKHEAFLGGQSLNLTPIEFKLLACLAEQEGKVLAHRFLLNQVWGPDYEDDRQYLKLYIWYLRQKLEDDPTNPKLILTQRGVGYRLARASESAQS